MRGTHPYGPVRLVEEDLRPRTIITEAAIRNAVAVCVAVGGSINAVRHLSAIAAEAELDLDVVDCFEQAGRSVPLVAAVRPNGTHRVSDLEAAGGARAIIKQIADHLDLSAIDVTGQPLSATLPSAVDDSVVRSASSPVSARGGLTILRGSLAPDGAIAKTAGMKRPEERFSGPAVVFDSEAEAIQALGTGRIRPGHVVVLRGLGPRGGPGTVFAASFAAAAVGAGLVDQIALVTDGELSGLNRGIVVGQVMPEAAEGGPLAYVADGDPVTIDIPNGLIDVQLQDGDRRHVAALPDAPRGWLSIYRSVVQPISKGATLLEPRSSRNTENAGLSNQTAKSFAQDQAPK